MILTVKHLEKIEACPSGISWFEDTFPNGVKISNSQDEMNELVASIDWYCKYSVDDYYAIHFLEFFLYETCCKEISAYSGNVKSILDNEFSTWECGAFLSDCSLLKD
jgi:hypothetical protein